MKNHPLSLDHETLHSEPPPTLIGFAADAGFSGVCLRLVRGRTDNFPVIGDTPMRREIRQLSKEYGIRILCAETIYIGPRFDAPTFKETLETCAFLEVPLISIVVVDTDLARAGSNLSAFADVAIEFGIQPIVEAAPLSAIKTIPDAVALIDDNSARNVALGCDTLHVVRGGGSAATIAAVSGRFRYCQINDGPAYMPPEGWMDEAFGRRLAPGEGEFPLAEIVDALPDGIPIGIEAPNWHTGMEPRERVHHVAKAARAVLGGRLLPA